MAVPYTSTTEIATFVANVNSATKDLENAQGSDVHAARRKLQVEARKLSLALDEPNEEVWPRIYQVRNVSSRVTCPIC